MAGHSHWANIKHKKEANDQQKGKLFGKVTREIILALNSSGGNTDPATNMALRTAVDKATAVGLPKENIKRIFERAKEKASELTEVVYEAMMHNGASFLIKTATDNPRRTHAELVTLLDRNNGKMVEKGGVAYLYDLCGAFYLEEKTSDDALIFAETVDALDMEEVPGGYYVYVTYDSLSEASNKAKTLGVERGPELVYRAKVSLELPENERSNAQVLYEKIEDHDDVQEVFTNIALK